MSHSATASSLAIPATIASVTSASVHDFPTASSPSSLALKTSNDWVRVTSHPHQSFRPKTDISQNGNVINDENDDGTKTNNLNHDENIRGENGQHREDQQEALVVPKGSLYKDFGTNSRIRPGENPRFRDCFFVLATLRICSNNLVHINKRNKRHS